MEIVSFLNHTFLVNSDVVLINIYYDMCTHRKHTFVHFEKILFKDMISPDMYLF